MGGCRGGCRGDCRGGCMGICSGGDDRIMILFWGFWDSFLGFNGVNLVAVSIGTQSSGQKVCKALSIDPSFVYASPSASLHGALMLRKSVRDTFFNPATPMAIARRIFIDPKDPLQGIRPGGTDGLVSVMGRWASEGLAILPPEKGQAREFSKV
ncbi:hypothetical protein TrRE_jg8720 [Triparma retinervis]|uniref:Uncharacterized protein n=1 Tax=Triparma retinervis TaxID=2557542 RepID=A0A9W6ZBJ0_9STRA|nr:hypothetical protein TrRE_jg8720 [Triparma retinervis]